MVSFNRIARKQAVSRDFKIVSIDERYSKMVVFSDPNLCSHIWALCYMSQSLFVPLVARQCSTYCPKAGIFQFFSSNSSENNFDEIQVINNVPQM